MPRRGSPLACPALTPHSLAFHLRRRLALSLLRGKSPRLALFALVARRIEPRGSFSTGPTRLDCVAAQWQAVRQEADKDALKNESEKKPSQAELAARLTLPETSDGKYLDGLAGIAGLMAELRPERRVGERGSCRRRTCGRFANWMRTFAGGPRTELFCAPLCLACAKPAKSGLRFVTQRRDPPSRLPRSIDG